MQSSYLLSKTSSHLLLFSKKQQKLTKELENIKIFDTAFITLSLKIFRWVPVCNQSKGAIKTDIRITDTLSIPEHVVIDLKNPNDNIVF